MDPEWLFSPDANNTDNRLKEIVRKDFFLLEEAVQKFNEQQYNTRAAKR